MHAGGAIQIARVGSLGVVVAALVGVAACPSPSPRSPGATVQAGAAIEIGRAGSLLTGVAGDGAMVFAALTAQPAPAPGRSPSETTAAPVTTPITTIEALRPADSAAPVWHTELPGRGGPLAVAGPRLVAVLGGTGNVAGLALRGEPGAALAALDAATGAPAWKLAVDSTEWAVIAAISPAGPAGDVVIGGSFAGTLRIADRVVSSAGETDGFVARLTAAGGVAWLIRIGGLHADAVHGVAAAGDRIAIAGTFAPGAELLGEPLVSLDDRSPRADGFVAELDAHGARRWVQSFGGKADDAIAGVAIDAAGRIAIAATAIDTVHIGGSELTASGAADGLVAWWGPDGTLLNAVLVGGPDFDGLDAIVAAGAPAGAPAGARIVVAGFYSGAIRLGSRTLTAGGGDDAFVAELDPAGGVVEAWPAGGDGREEITALAAIPGGFLAGVAHTAAAQLDGTALPAPADPMSGAAILIRPLR